MCTDLCGKIISHAPFRGKETAEKEERYAATLARYNQMFGHAAPVAQWPASSVNPNSVTNTVLSVINSMWIYIHFKSSDIYTIAVHPTDSIKKVKAKIQEQEGISIEEMSLISR